MRAALALVAALSWAGPAHAQPTTDLDARTHFQAGSSYYSQGRYEEALREFEEAFRLAADEHKGLMVFNVGQAEERLGRLSEAVASFRQYLELDPAASDRAAVEDRIRNLEARLAQTGIALTVSEAGARVAIDGREVGTTPLDGPVLVTPGSHELRIEKPGFQPFRLRVSVSAGERVAAEATLVPAAGGRGRTFTWVAAGVAGVALATGAVLGTLALGASDAANEERANDHERYDDARSRAETLALGADVSFGVAVIAAAGTVVLFILEGRDSAASEHASAAVVPVASGRGLGLSISESF